MGNEESSNEEGIDIWEDDKWFSTLGNYLEEAKQSLNYEKIYLLYCLQFKNKFIK